jgi:hypothetical protein
MDMADRARREPFLEQLGIERVQVGAAEPLKRDRPELRHELGFDVEPRRVSVDGRTLAPIDGSQVSVR